uniref:valine--tRNA ligase n=1 Tax=Haptolina ericina TaxID=156174 RepID=A0A7S3F538_9EUKA|mmetsp:Transcript_51475/g.115626  ORF Transcript_51475/g.115626 Transcript_51475/m.115626 type:complete len:337 (+) Transcript_51475:227-1237(+)
MDVPLSMEKVEANRNFANKLWNTARFITMGLGKLDPTARASLAVTAPMEAEELASLPLPERWVVSRCHTLVRTVTEQLTNNDFGPAGQAIYSFLWDDYADWYIEISKKRIGGDDVIAQQQAQRTLVYVLDSCLRLLHPFMPFITEEVWQRLPHEGPSLMIADWPQRDDEPLCVDADAEQRFGSLQALVRSVRNARAEYRVEPGKLIAATVIAGELEPTLAAETEAITSLARIDPAAFSFQGADAEGADGAVVRLVVEDSLEAVLPLAGLVDSDKERVRLGKQQTKLEASIAKVSKRLEAPGFVDKAPPAVLEKARTELAEQEEQLQGVLDALKQLP